MNVARGLEKRLERLLEGVAGRVFSGRLHPSELASKLAREADFARFEHQTGPATANRFVVHLNPRDLTMDARELEALLTDELTEQIEDEGLRVEGPIEVLVSTHESNPVGQVRCHVEVSPGPGTTWANLVASGETYPVARNRAIIGRSPESDVLVPHDDVSRSHALLYRERGQIWIVDLESANGTLVDGQAVGSEPVAVQAGSRLTLASHSYRLVLA